MSYDVKAKHSDLIVLLSEQYKLYEEARSAFLSAEWDRQRERYKSARHEEGHELAIRSLQEDISWEASNEDKKKMDIAGMKLHLAIRHVVKHYSYWHTGRIRAASGISRFDWALFMTPLCLPDYLSMDFEVRQRDDWSQAVDLAMSFMAEEGKGMSGRRYVHELFKRANNLLDMKHAQLVG